MRHGILVFLQLIFAWTSANAETECWDGSCSKEPFAKLAELSDSMSPILGKAAIESVPDLCRINGYRDAKEFKLHEGEGYNVWASNFIAAGDHREKIFNSLITPEVIESVKKLEPLSEAQKTLCKKDIEYAKNHPRNQEEQIKATLPKAAFFCGLLRNVNISSCSDSVLEIAKIAHPVDDITLHDVWAQVLTDPIYNQVMKKIALKNLDLIKQKEIPKTRFYDDINSAFFELTNDHKKADDYTFNLLGVLSSGGNSSHNFIPWLGVPAGLKNVIFLLNQGSAVLDRRTANQKNGFLYSYPKEVDSLCDYGKNYHFWMSAFLAREAVKKSGDVCEAAAAAFSAGKAYQFMKVGGGRDPRKPFKENMFSNYNNNIRLDLSQLPAGAFFGAASLNPERRKILTREKSEKGLRKIFEGSVMVETDPKFDFPTGGGFFAMAKLLRIYPKWSSVINPDAAFEFYGNDICK